jgi:hypothetical protein
MVELLARDFEPGEPLAEITEISENPIPVRLYISFGTFYPDNPEGEERRRTDELRKATAHLFEGMTTAGACKVVFGDSAIVLAEVRSKTSEQFDSIAWMDAPVDMLNESSDNLVHDTVAMSSNYHSTSVEEFEEQWELWLEQSEDGEDEADESELPEVGEREHYGHDA